MLQKLLERKTEIIENTDPDRIYVENIRSFFRVPYTLARFFCEMAVREKFFKKKVGVFCTNDDCRRLIQTHDIRADINEEIICDICEDLEKEKFVFKKNDLDITEFYQLVK